jgi:hypothetical protein
MPRRRLYQITGYVCNTPGAGDPLPTLAQDAKQRMIEGKGVLHGYLLGKRQDVEDLSDHEGRRRGEHAFLPLSLICSSLIESL